MNKLTVIILWLVVTGANTLVAATYYVAKTGNDSTGTGSSAAPWATVQKAVNVMVAGDTVLVQPGTYVENVTTVRSGTAGNYISIQGQGLPTLGYFLINQHAFIKLDGFKFGLNNGRSNFVLVKNGSSYCTISSNDFNSTAYDVNGVAIGEWNGTPPPPSAHHIHLLRNKFHGAVNSVSVSISGYQCLCEGNEAYQNGQDFFRLFGSNNTVRANYMHDCYEAGNHTDFVQAWASIETAVDQVIENNLVDGNNQHQIGNIETRDWNSFFGGGLHPEVIHGWIIRNNIFRNCATFFIKAPGFSVINNLFWNTTGGANTSLSFGNDAAGAATNGFVLNNVFIGGAIDTRGYGYYQLAAGINITRDYNYVGKSAAANWAADTSFAGVEPHGMNGGNPWFANYSNYDFHLLPTSPLILSGTNLYNSFTTDLDTMARPATGPWDRGPYHYGGTGVTFIAGIAVTPNTLDFGTIAPMTVATNSITVQNTGNATLTGMASVNGPVFTILSGGTYSLGAYQSQPVTIRYAPTVVGTTIQNVIFTGGGGATSIISGAATVNTEPPVTNSTSGTLFADEFSRTTLAPWSSVLGSWSLANGILRGVAAAGSYGYALVTTNWTDYSMEGRIQLSADTYGAGLGGRVNPTTGAHYGAWLYPAGGASVLKLIKFSNWTSWSGTPMQQVSLSAVGTNWHTLKLLFTGPRIRVYYDGVMKLDVTDSGFDGRPALLSGGISADLSQGTLNIDTVSASSLLTPVISAISQSGTDVNTTKPGIQVFAGSVVQYSGSASDLNGSPLSWLWLYTTNGTETVVLSGTGTISNVTFNYPGTSAGSLFNWKLRVSNSYAGVETNLQVGVEYPPAPADGLTIQAGSGTLTAPFISTNGYIAQPQQTTNPASGGRAVYPVSITYPGNYIIQALVNSPNNSANSFYLNMDTEPQDPTMIWDIPTTSSFEQRVASWRGNGTDLNNQFVPKIFTLTQGVHQVIFRGREANVQLQSFRLLALPPPPRNLRITPDA